tara:strand:- start:132 stop:1340 length:1209 start_codon:yes stop_codon:yes gene_type:complete
MAKQKGSGVVAAALRVSESQGQFQDQVGQFMTGYDKAMETKNKMEARNQELQAKTNAYVDQFNGDIDLADFGDEDKSVVKGQVITYRNEFVEGAQGAAKIKDKSSTEYQMYVDKMNSAQQKMVKLRGNLQGVANLKIEYKNGFEQREYSNSQKNSENLLRANTILEGSISSIGEDGSLNFKGYTIPGLANGGEDMIVEDFSYNTKNFKKPFNVATEQANQILDLSAEQETLKGEATENQVRVIEANLKNILSNKDVLYSILSNSELQLIPLNGIDPDDPNAEQQAINMLTQGILDSRGAAIIEEAPKPGRGTSTASNVIKPGLEATVSDMEAFEKEILTGQFTGPRKTRSWSIGGSRNPEQLKIKYDPEIGKWKYLNASAGESRIANSLKELMMEIPNLFYK